MPITVSGFSVTLGERVRETTQTTGTGTYSLDGAPSGKVTFLAGIGNGNHTLYAVEMGANWEVGIGVVATGTPATLTRTSILSSTNAGNAVNWGVGVKDIFCDAAAALFHGLQDQINTVPITRAKATTFTVNGTLTTDADTVFAWVRVVGAGGAGGGAPATGAAQVAEGGGGGAGEYAEALFTAAQLGASKSVTVGTGGTGVSGGTGNTGGTTNFGTGLITAIGGSGGTAGTAGTNGTASGGAGGTGGTGGTVRLPGSGGGPGTTRGGLRGATAYGGASALGGSQRHNGAVGAGQPGLQAGGGGTGGSIDQNSGAVAGGAGAAGACFVIEYLHT